MGAITAGVIGLPLCLAFGTTSGMGPIAGLYGGIALGLLAAIFGGTPTQISAPTGPMTVVAGLIVAGEISHFGSLEAAFPIIILTFLLGGLLQMLLGVLKVGSYISYLPYPVISGFMSGIGVIVITMQFKEFFGAEVGHGNAIQNLVHLPDYISDIHWPAVSVALVTLATAIIANRYLKKIVPGALLALVVGILFTYLFNMDVKLLGHIPSGIPSLHFEIFGDISFGRITHIILPALTLAGLGMIDSLLTSVIADKVTKTKHNSNRELIGQGIGNMGAALFGGIPGAGTTVVTLANSKSAKTRVSGVIQALFLLTILLFGSQYASFIPYPVLAGILISIGIDIIDYTVLRELKIIPSSDKVIIATVFILTITWSLLYATAIGFLLAALFFMKKMADTIDRSSKDSELDKITNKLIDMFDDNDSFKNDVYIKVLKGPIFFGFANRLEEDIKQHPSMRALLLDFKDVPYMDQTGLYSVRDAIIDLSNRDISVYLTGANGECIRLLKGVNIIPEYVPVQHVFDNIEDCVIWMHDHIDVEDPGAKFGLEIPSAFTPNDDGANDEWKITGLEKYPKARLFIFSEDGKMIFESNGVKTWDGKLGSKLAPTGKYHYKLSLNINDIIEGMIILVR